MAVEKVIGPPGTGKTTWIARQVSIALEKGYLPMVLSLTRAAAAEAKGEINNLPSGHVGTLHSAAYRGLNGPTLIRDKGVRERWNAEHATLAMGELSEDLDDRTAANIALVDAKPRNGDMLLREYDLLRAHHTPRDRWRDQMRLWAELWDGWKAKNNVMDFTDLITHALARVPSAPGTPTVIFVDEAQDLSAVEYKLVEKWGKAAGRLVLVGDPWQNLYRWRGADPDLLGTPDVVLKRSHRVPRAVHDVATTWMRFMGRYPALEYLPDEREGEVHRGVGTWRTPDLRAVNADLDAGLTVMILASCAFHLVPTIQAARALGLPFGNRWRLRNASWNPLRGGGAGVLSAYLDLSTSGELSFERLFQWVRRVKVKGVLRKGVLRKDLQRQAEEGGAIDTGALYEVLTDEAMDAVLRGDTDWLMEHATMGAASSLRYALQVMRVNGVDALTDEPRLTIGTIHSTKGAEASSVYLYPDLSNSGYENWLAHHDHPARRDIARLMYVGMTRARDKLTLMPAHRRKAVGWPIPEREGRCRPSMTAPIGGGAPKRKIVVKPRRKLRAVVKPESELSPRHRERREIRYAAPPEICRDCGDAFQPGGGLLENVLCPLCKGNRQLEASRAAPRRRGFAPPLPPAAFMRRAAFVDTQGPVGPVDRAKSWARRRFGG